MQRYLLQRVVQSAVVLLGLSLLVFTLLVYTPGDPVELIAESNPDVQPADVQRLRQYYGLDDPFSLRYLKWLRALAQGDFGYSRTYGLPVITLIGQRLGNTLLLVGTAFVIAFLAGTAVGVYSALHQYSVADYGFTAFSFAGLAMPNFWQGIVLILIFAVWLPLFPAGGMATPGVTAGWPAILDRLWHLVLPVVVLATSGMASWARYMRSSMLEVIRQDYVRTARAKGLAERTVLYKHALRNGLIPVITVVGLQFGALLAGAMVTETIFSWPGVGRLLLQAINSRDYPLVQGCILAISVSYIAVNALTDVLYSVVDPRIRRR